LRVDSSYAVLRVHACTWMCVCMCVRVPVDKKARDNIPEAYRIIFTPANNQIPLLFAAK